MGARWSIRTQGGRDDIPSRDKVLAAPNPVEGRSHQMFGADPEAVQKELDDTALAITEARGECHGEQVCGVTRRVG